MIAVYCGKAVESWISAEWAGLIGVVAGAAIAFIGNYIVQSRVLSRTAEIENQKIRASIIGQQILVDVYSFLDKEARYLQELRLNVGSSIPSGIADHRMELSKIRSLVQMLRSSEIEAKFTKLIQVKNEFEEAIVHQDNVDLQAILDKGIQLIADIKSALISEVISPTQQ